MYALVNDNMTMREAAKDVGEEELAEFIGSKANMQAFQRSEDAHLLTSRSYIIKTMACLGVTGNTFWESDEYNIDDCEVDIE